MKNKNIIDYAKAAKDNFEQRQFNYVDSLILSQLAYLHFDGLVSNLNDSNLPLSIKKIAAENPEILYKNVRNYKSNQELLFAVAKSRRFQDIKLTYYVNKFDEETEKQFSAVTYLLSDNSAYIAYRGTDSTFVGWKEDFNMTFICPTPSQVEGVEYLNYVANMISCKLRIGGHSKGGNLAVYSTMNCNKLVRDRIIQTFNHDGPGFIDDDIFENEGYIVLKDKIHKTIPQSSLFGMLLQNEEIYSVVKSNRIWFMQHDPFSWQIDGNDFKYIPSIDKYAFYMDEILNQWVKSLEEQKRIVFVNTLFKIIQETNTATFSDLTTDWPKKALIAVEAMKEIDDETRKLLFQVICSFLILAMKNIAK